jgi:hypothetical protein
MRTLKTPQRGGHVEAPNESTEEDDPSRLLRISSVVFGKDQAEMLRKKYDADGDNHIDSQELARVVADMMKNKAEKRHLKRALIGSLAAVVVLLCSTFATSWAAASLSRKVNANDNTGDLINEETGKTAATRPRNDLCHSRSQSRLHRADEDALTRGEIGGVRQQIRALLQRDPRQHWNKCRGSAHALGAEDGRHAWGFGSPHCQWGHW